MKNHKPDLLIFGFALILIILFSGILSCKSPEMIQERKCQKAQLKYERAAYKWGCLLVQNSDTITDTQTIQQKRDTTIYIYIAGDTVSKIDTVIKTEGIINTPENRIDTKYAYSVSYVKDSKLYHILVQKEAVISKTIKDAIQNNIKIEYKTIVREVVKKTNYLTQWQIGQMWLGRLMLVILVLVIAYYVIKFTVKKSFLP